MKYAATIMISACTDHDGSNPRDLVEFFGQQMPRDWAEMLEATQRETHYRDSEGKYERTPYGSESFIKIDNTKITPCRHCDTIFNKLHEPGCDYEQCPKCNYGIMNCECEFQGHEWRDPPKSG